MHDTCTEIKSYMTLTFKSLEQKHGVRSRISFSFVSDCEKYETWELGYVKAVIEKYTSTTA